MTAGVPVAQNVKCVLLVWRWYPCLFCMWLFCARLIYLRSIVGPQRNHHTTERCQRYHLLMFTSKTASYVHLLINILSFSYTDGQWFLSIASFDVVHFSDGFRVLGQTGQAVDGVCGDSNHMTLLQSLHRATQDFSTICSSKTRSVNDASSTAW